MAAIFGHPTIERTGEPPAPLADPPFLRRLDRPTIDPTEEG